MLNDFLIAIGVRRPTVEEWRCDQLVIVDVDGQIVWCRPGVIEYKPSLEAYWGGQAAIYDVGTTEPRFLYTFERIEHNDENSLLVPFFGRRGGRRGARIHSIDESGERMIIYVGQHALNYIAARAQVEASEEAAVEDEEEDE